ncbi:MAG: aminotransferase class I/II-fold pyridoxal phosphate-dependent enzyme [Azospirillaceae bacterium]|nr:aminotransferase class I/II-fold pyridoxal phosphate-dependent enzyme [Azospirillaceae bacterium]
MDVMRAANARQAAQGDVLHLEVGQPATPAPQAVLAAAQRALGCDRLGYTDALGLPALREAIAGWYRHRYGLAVPPERIVVTTGSSGGFLLSFLAAFDPGDRVALVAPGYPAYRNILKAVDCEPVDLPAGPENRFQIEAAMLDRLQQAVQGLIIASPSNPTGTMLATAELAALAQWCRQRGVWLVSDEIYHGISYIGPAQTALAVSDDVIVVNSFSKYFSMTGWRLGWIVVPPAMVRAVECLAQNLFISPPTLSQLAALAVFDCEPELDANVACYARNRELLLEQLPKAGFDRLAPADGAFYIYADIAALSDDSRALARRLLDETGVAVTPGVDFDPIRGHRYLRFSFAGATADMAEAARRLIAWRSR